MIPIKTIARKILDGLRAICLTLSRILTAAKLFMVRLAETIRQAWLVAAVSVSVYGKTGAFGAVHRGQYGLAAGNAVETLILVFIAIIVIYQLIPMISSSNQTVQNAENVSAMGKFSAGLGEWLFPLLGVVAIVFLLFKQAKGRKGT